jgi:hypothetical protein
MQATSSCAARDVAARATKTTERSFEDLGNAVPRANPEKRLVQVRATPAPGLHHVPMRHNRSVSLHSTTRDCPRAAGHKLPGLR